MTFTLDPVWAAVILTIIAVHLFYYLVHVARQFFLRRQVNQALQQAAYVKQQQDEQFRKLSNPERD